jgi:EAL domain-containing protein (putative c-di-GMP-specific phosphodiesterase class I)
MENLSPAVEEAVTLAQQLGVKLSKAMDKPFDLGGHEYHCRLSVGVGLFNAQNTVDELFKRADLALYEAKNAGRNTLRFFDPAMQAAIDWRNKMEEELRHAFDGRQLQLYVQPQDDSTRRVTGVEALLRWQHPERGLVLPGEFIPLAEESGLILPIGHWVLETACAWIKKWERDIRLGQLSVSVNVSVRQFREPDFCDRVQAILSTSGANPARLKLELTESIVLHDVEDAIAKMRTIKGLGVGFSMDDFGTGYSSLSYLARLPIDQLKIDRSFVRNLPGNSGDEAIARTIITLGRELDMNVIAEGVETEAQREFLEAHGCQAYQGYLVGYPVTLSEFEKYLKRA